MTEHIDKYHFFKVNFFTSAPIFCELFHFMNYVISITLSKASMALMYLNSLILVPSTHSEVT